MVKTICYGKVDEWENRNDAIKFFQECAFASDGSEKERYMKVLLGLISGFSVCTDDD